MAISWGPSTTSGTNRFRLGYELTFSPAVTASTSSVTVTLRLYVGTRYSVYDTNNSYSVTGDYARSGAVNISHGSSSAWSSANVTLIGAWNKTVSLSYTARPKVSFSASMSGLEATPGTARVAGSITLPLRPVSAPAAPSQVTVGRSSDTRHTVTWKNNPTTAAPYDKIQVSRWDSASGTFKVIAPSLSGTATSFVDASTVANRRYRYAVRAINGWGNGGYGYSPYFYTSPAGPSTVTATKRGSDIRVQWQSPAMSAAHYEIQDYADGVAQEPLRQTGANASEWTHSDADPAKTHRYRVRSVIVDPTVGRVVSSWSVYSNTVQLQSPPAAPTKLTPSTGAVDATEDTELSWQHNAIDTTAQSAYELRHRVQGGAWETTGKVDSATSSHVFQAGTWTNGQMIEWEVRTWGEHATGSGYSALAVFGTSSRPTATILAPVGELGGSEIVASWAFYDSEGSVQNLARVSLYDAAGALVERQTIVGPASSYRFKARAQDGQSYTIGVEVRDAAGVWSIEASETITVSYLPPPTAHMSATWDVDTGSVVVEISHPAPAAGEVDGVQCELWRSANGDDWVLLSDGLDLDTTLVDRIPAVEGVNYYRVVTTSALPSTAEAPSLGVPVACDGWVYINAGADFAQLVKVRDNARTSYSPGRNRQAHHFAGRRYPVEVTGQSRTLGISVNAQIGGGSSTLSEIEELFDLPAPLLYRDITRRVFVGKPSVSASMERTRQAVSMSFEAVDHHE